MPSAIAIVKKIFAGGIINRNHGETQLARLRQSVKPLATTSRRSGFTAQTGNGVKATLPGADALAALFSEEPGAVLQVADANLDKVLDKTAASTNALVSGLAGKFTTTNSHCPQLGHSPAYDLDWPCVAETWELYRRLGRAAGVPAGFAQAQYAAIAYAGLRDLKKARAAAQEGLENAKLKDEERYELSVMTALIDAGADVGRIKSAEERLAKEIPLKADLRKKMLERALGLAVLSCDDAFARAATTRTRNASGTRFRARRRWSIRSGGVPRRARSSAT